MLALIEIPEDLQMMYAQYKETSQAIYDQIKDLGREQKVPQGADLLRLAQEPVFIYISDGFFKLLINDQTVRLYSGSDFVVSEADPGAGTALKSEFGGKVVIFRQASLIENAIKQRDLLDALFNLANLENNINRTLAAAFMRQETIPDFLLVAYEEGETIINEGDNSTEIFEMISGSAKAMQGSTEVGIINEGEIFGEVSFFTKEPRNATVIATQSCMVRVISEDNFASMIKGNPNFAISISRTLAKRSSEVNRRLSAKNR